MNDADPSAFGVGHIEPDTHSDDSAVEDVRRSQIMDDSYATLCLTLATAHADDFVELKDRQSLFSDTDSALGSASIPSNHDALPF